MKASAVVVGLASVITILNSTPLTLAREDGGLWSRFRRAVGLPAVPEVGISHVSYERLVPRQDPGEDGGDGGDGGGDDGDDEDGDDDGEWTDDGGDDDGDGVDDGDDGDDGGDGDDGVDGDDGDDGDDEEPLGYGPPPPPVSTTSGGYGYTTPVHFHHSKLDWGVYVFDVQHGIFQEHISLPYDIDYGGHPYVYDKFGDISQRIILSECYAFSRLLFGDRVAST
ncbi:hypothetical protein QC762_0020450 [Podospora pseudocomata]|uniref:Uncharacterized protein n=1 Tax=Podospora pseudocomata TaxID=2093779 RepID=A0ABR0GXQ8_9PEZI|nr:hypothetical protein QC762_0020450 [Podospora pseudocomata]